MKTVIGNNLASEMENHYEILWPINIVLKDGEMTVTVSEEIADKVDFLCGMTEQELTSEENIVAMECTGMYSHAP